MVMVVCKSAALVTFPNFVCNIVVLLSILACILFRGMECVAEFYGRCNLTSVAENYRYMLGVLCPDDRQIRESKFMSEIRSGAVADKGSTIIYVRFFLFYRDR